MSANPPKPRPQASPRPPSGRDWRMHDWPPELVEEYEERAALIEDGCKVTREEAESLAFRLLNERFRNTFRLT